MIIKSRWSINLYMGGALVIHNGTCVRTKWHFASERMALRMIYENVSNNYCLIHFKKITVRNDF